MGMLERFFHVAAILSIMIFVVNMSLMTFTQPLLGTEVSNIMVAGVNDTNIAVSKISQSSYTPNTAAIDTGGIGGVMDFIDGIANKYSETLGWIFANVDTTQHCEYTLGIFPTNCNDSAEMFGAMLINLIRLFQIIGLVYIGIAIIAALLGGGAP